MPEEQSPFVTAGHEARAKHRIGIFVEEKFDHLQQIARMIFQVGVMDHNQFGIDILQRGADGRTFALIAAMPGPHPGKFLEILTGFEALTKALERDLS